MDRVRLLKRESSADGGDPADESPWPEPINSQEDAIETAGMYVQDASNRDENILIWRDGNNLKFKDVNYPSGRTLSQLAGNGGSGGNDIHISIVRDEQKPFVELKIETYTTQAYFIFRGTSAFGAPIAIKVVAWAKTSGQDYGVRIYDVTNSNQICEITDDTSTPGIRDMGTLSNLPTSEALFEVQGKRIDDDGRLASVIVEF
jgi:hypothetical protein